VESDGNFTGFFKNSGWEVGMRKGELISQLKDFFKKRGEVYKIELAFLFGSWCRGYPNKNSDVDIALLFENPFAPEEIIFETINKVSVEISEKIKMDANIIPIYPDFRKPMLYYNAIVKGEPVYVKDLSKLGKIRWEAISHMEDFSIFGLRWQIESAEKNLKELTYA